MILLCLAALFYLVTGLYAARTVLRFEIIEHALDLIQAQPRPFWVKYQMTCLAIGSLTIALGALLLLFRVDLAVYVTVAAILQQAIYFYYLAPRWIDPVDPPDPAGRRSAHNAFLGYSVYGAAVAWAFATGRLGPVTALSDVELYALAACTAAWLGYGFWLLRPYPWR